jgi:hypothetical protein
MEDWRLLTFNVFDKNNLENDENRFTQSKSNKEFTIQMFGINEKGETVSIYVEGYSPFFYIKVPDNWKDSHRCGIINQIREELGYYSESIINHKFVEQKTLYGFDGGKEHKFVLFKFENM